MNKTIPPTINLTHNNPFADAGAQAPDSLNSAELWRSTLENQARFFNECTNDVLVQMTRNRLLMANQLKQMSAHGERIMSLMAHTACRALAIATHARQKSCDRRVFNLPLPDERRFDKQIDRRKFMSANEQL